MKKILLGTSALVGVAAFAGAASAQGADPISLSVGGKFEGYVTFQDADNYGRAGTALDYGSTGITEDSELYFDGETTLDNGLTVGVAIDMEVSGATTNQDEAYAYVSGGFGEVQAGTKDQVTAQFATAPGGYAAPFSEGFATAAVPYRGAANLGAAGGAAGVANSVALTGGTAFATSVAVTNGWGNHAASALTFTNGSDDATVTYISPNMAGFQIGASFTPNVTGAAGMANTAGSWHNRMDVAAMYSGSMSGADISGDLGYTTRNNPGVGQDDPTVLQGGLSVGMAGFTMGGRYVSRDLASGADQDTWIMGLGYATGPYDVGLNYVDGSWENTGVADDDADAWELRGSYAMGPGVSLIASAFMVDYEDGSANTDNDGTGVSTGLQLSF